MYLGNQQYLLCLSMLVIALWVLHCLTIARFEDQSPNRNPLQQALVEVILACQALLATSTLCCGCAETYPWFIVGRIFQANLRFGFAVEGLGQEFIFAPGLKVFGSVFIWAVDS